MQLANSTLKLSAIAALIAHSAFAAAQLAPPAAPVSAGPVVGAPIPAPLGAPPVAAAPATGDARTASASAVKSVAIGKNDDTLGAVGTLRELETLQREVYLGELRAKVRGLNAPDKSSTPAPQYGAGPVAPGINVAAGPQSQYTQPASSQPMPVPVFNPPIAAYGEMAGEPSAQLVSVIVSNGRSRADVMDNGIIKTVKEGDMLGDWAVVSIVPNGVKVERTAPDASRGTVPGLVRTPIASTSKVKKPVVFAAVAAAPAERTISAMLKPYIPPAPPAQTNAVGQSFVPAVIPPLPSQIKFPDSASIGAATAVNSR